MSPTGPLTFEALESVLAAGDAAAVVACFRGRSERERRAVAPAVLDWCRHNRPRGDDRETVLCALLACASLGELRRRRAGLWGRDYGAAAYQALADRAPPWVASYVDFLLPPRAEGWWDPPWWFCRQLVRAGLCPRPDGDDYVRAMIPYGDGVLRARQAERVRALLRDDPDLLEHEVWRLFEVEGRLSPGYSLTSDGPGWLDALVGLAGDGTVSRPRLLDAALAALARDFSAYNARWYQELHDALAPTDDELAHRAEAYAALLASQVSTTVGLALAALERLEADEDLDPGLLLAHVAAVLEAAPKVHAERALRLVDRVLRRAPDQRRAGVRTCCAALGHDHSDVQQRALRVVACHADPGDTDARADLLAAAETVAPPLRAELERLTGVSLDALTDRVDGALPGGLARRAAALPAALRRRAGVDDAQHAVADARLPPALAVSPLGVPVATPETTLDAIEDLDDLLALLARLLEGHESAEDLERALDGVSRLCGSRPADLAERSGPVRKRARGLLRDGWQDSGIRREIARLVATWLGDEVEEVALDPTPAEELPSARIRALTERAARGRARPLLAAPTHEGGWVLPEAFADRLADVDATGEEAEAADAVQALLRLAVSQPGTAVSRLRSLEGDVARAARRALGDDTAGTVPEALEAAAPLARSPDGAEVAVRTGLPPEMGPDPVSYARAMFELQARLARLPEGVDRRQAHLALLGELGARAARGGLPAEQEEGVAEADTDAAPAAAAAAEWARRDLPADAAREVDERVAAVRASLERDNAVVLPLEVGGWQLPLGRRARSHGWDPLSVRWDASAWPGRHGPLFAAAASLARRLIDVDGPVSVVAAYLEPLFDPDAGIPASGLELLGLTLGSRDPGVRDLAVEAVIAAVDDGRLDAGSFGAALADLLGSGPVAPARLARALRTAAEASPLHAAVVRGTLERVLPALTPPPDDLHALLELLLDLCVEAGAGVAEPQARRYLDELEGRSRRARLAAELLARDADEDPQLPAAAVLALEGRVRRAERWAQHADT